MAGANPVDAYGDGGGRRGGPRLGVAVVRPLGGERLALPGRRALTHRPGYRSCCVGLGGGRVLASLTVAAASPGIRLGLTRSGAGSL